MNVRQVGVKRIEATFHAAVWFQTRLADQPFETVSFVTHLAPVTTGCGVCVCSACDGLCVCSAVLSVRVCARFVSGPLGSEVARQMPSCLLADVGHSRIP